MTLNPAQQLAALQQQTQRNKRRNLLISIFSVATLLVASLGTLGWLLFKPVTQDVMLQAAGYVTANPFAADPFAGAPDPSLAQPLAAAGTVPTDPLTTVSTGSTGVDIYGGSTQIDVCDAGKFLKFMEDNPTQAQAWVDALNADATITWATGALTPADIPAYLQTLAPVVLMNDTIVMNHDFVNGKAVPYQAVLQAGTAVMADMWGVPRLQCYCGNPLTTPPGIVNNVNYSGTPWVGFNPANVIALNQPNSPVPTLTVTNLSNPGQQLLVGPVVCNGNSCNVNVQPANANSTPTPTPAPTAAPTPTPTPTPTAAPTPTPTQTSAPTWIQNPNPVPPASDVCTGLIGTKFKTPDANMHSSPILNNTNANVDIWIAELWWSGTTTEGDITDCKPLYMGTLPPGGFDSIWAYLDQPVFAFDSQSGAGPIDSWLHFNNPWTVN